MDRGLFECDQAVSIRDGFAHCANLLAPCYAVDVLLLAEYHYAGGGKYKRTRSFVKCERILFARAYKGRSKK
jgi:hypothetical protein